MSSRAKRAGIVTATAIIAGFLTTAATTTPAVAACAAPDENTIVTIDKKARTLLPTNLMSDWLEGPGVIIYHKTTTATVSATVSASATFGASVVLAKAETTFGVELGYSYSWSDEWEYQKPVPDNKEGRLRMYHDAVGFRATVKRWNKNTCKYVTSVGDVKLPKKTGENVWKLQTRKPVSTRAAAATIEETVIDVEPATTWNANGTDLDGAAITPSADVANGGDAGSVAVPSDPDDVEQELIPIP
jgi:hypothetical protein